MIDSMLLWLIIILFSSLWSLFSFRVSLGYMNQGGVLGGGGLKCVKPGFGGFWGVNPGFTDFGGLGPVLGVWFI
jgi:hypothetical protein